MEFQKKILREEKFVDVRIGRLSYDVIVCDNYYRLTCGDLFAYNINKDIIYVYGFDKSCIYCVDLNTNTTTYVHPKPVHKNIKCAGSMTLDQKGDLILCGVYRYGLLKICQSNKHYFY